MIQAIERLELPAPTYRALQRIAAQQEMTLPEVVADMVQRFQTQETANALRQEYQRLADKALMRTITRREEKRMDALCKQIEALSALSQRTGAQKQQEQTAEALIAKSEALLEMVRQQASR